MVGEKRCYRDKNYMSPKMHAYFFLSIPGRVTMDYLKWHIATGYQGVRSEISDSVKTGGTGCCMREAKQLVICYEKERNFMEGNSREIRQITIYGVGPDLGEITNVYGRGKEASESSTPYI
jgi:hypothetical protein